jgi:hypothetical protein
MQKVTVGIFDPLDRHGGVVFRNFAEVEKHVVQRLQQIVIAVRTDQIRLLMGVKFV